MTDKVHEGPEDEGRRDFIESITGVVAVGGMAAATWPFIQSMNPSRDVLSKATTEVDIKDIQPGESKTVSWQGKPVFIMRRTVEEIEQMKGEGEGKDPEPDEARAKNPEWLVVIGLCTHLGCVPNRKKDGWFCPCHGSSYDNSGRILRGPAPRNLELPPYEFLAADKILIGKKA
ncbi:MAG: ubiquinol-cytochrome c reductase iron-sulfur subunit [Gammaproteobacteria bacterium]|nr:ubiquinol-cytochrome c reductase iron-sulfur subunit [Gammaproteobacteria bacterium]